MKVNRRDGPSECLEIGDEMQCDDCLPLPLHALDQPLDSVEHVLVGVHFAEGGVDVNHTFCPEPWQVRSVRIGQSPMHALDPGICLQ